MQTQCMAKQKQWRTIRSICSIGGVCVKIGRTIATLFPYLARKRFWRFRDKKNGSANSYSIERMERSGGRSDAPTIASHVSCAFSSEFIQLESVLVCRLHAINAHQQFRKGSDVTVNMKITGQIGIYNERRSVTDVRRFLWLMTSVQATDAETS